MSEVLRIYKLQQCLVCHGFGLCDRACFPGYPSQLPCRDRHAVTHPLHQALRFPQLLCSKVAHLLRLNSAPFFEIGDTIHKNHVCTFWWLTAGVSFTQKTGIHLQRAPSESDDSALSRSLSDASIQSPEEDRKRKRRHLQWLQRKASR